MENKKRLLVRLLLGLPSLSVTPAWAGNDTTAPSSNVISINAETQEFSRGFGSLRTVRIEYKDVLDSTTVLFAPVIGRRTSATTSEASVGGSLEVYQKWTPRVSTRTALFVSEDKQVFANIDAAQDVTVAFGKKFTATAGVRWAEYANGDKVVFISLGGRRYFKRGSIAYRATYTRPNGESGYVAHMVNLTLSDPTGRGKTQFWIGYGDTKMDRALFKSNFNETDYGGTVRRVQPLGNGKIDMVFLLGVTAYGNPTGRVWGKTAGLGLSLNLGD